MTGDYRASRFHHLEEEKEGERLRSTYRRNFILMILSLGAALLALVVSRLWGPVSDFLRQNPESSSLEKALSRAMPDVEFRVRMGKESGRLLLEISATVGEAPETPERFLARIFKIIYDEDKFENGDVVVRLYEMWRSKPEEPPVSIGVERTTIERIRKRLSR